MADGLWKRGCKVLRGYIVDRLDGLAVDADPGASVRRRGDPGAALPPPRTHELSYRLLRTGKPKALGLQVYPTKAGLARGPAGKPAGS